MSEPSTATELFFEDFTGNEGQERFEWGVYHRNAGWQIAGEPIHIHGDNNAGHGGSWTGDHDLSGGPPSTQRVLTSEKLAPGPNWQANFDFHVNELVYTARDHLMTSMGDVDNYSVVWFSPKQTFDAVEEVTFDVNLTNLGARQWIKVGIVSEEVYQSLGRGGMPDGNTAPAHVRSDVTASNLNNSLQDDGVLIATWGGGASAGHGGGMKIGDGDARAFSNPTPSDKMMRHHVSLKDNGDGTVTFSVAGVSITDQGSFPDGPVRVVFYDHNYTPDKDGTPIGHTWHWDNFRVLSTGSDAAPIQPINFVGTEGDDYHVGQASDDQLSGREGNDYLDGAAGNDQLMGGAGDDELIGGLGDDTIYASEKLANYYGKDVARGGDGNDIIWGSNGANRLYGDDGDDIIDGGDDFDTSEVDLLYGGNGNDTLTSGQVRPVRAGFEAGDRLYGEAGNDMLIGGFANDLLVGGAGDDELYGGGGADTIYVSEQLANYYGKDIARGGDGNDIIWGSNGANRLYGDDGDDIIDGGDDFDTSEVDLLYGGNGNDTLTSGQVRPVRAGFEAGDRLYGEAGNDMLIGGFANDVLDGGSGNDSLTGGDGVDIFVLSAGYDLVEDFEDGLDLIQLTQDQATSLTISQLGPDLLLSVDESQMLLVDVDFGLITASDFDILA